MCRGVEGGGGPTIISILAEGTRRETPTNKSEQHKRGQRLVDTETLNHPGLLHLPDQPHTPGPMPRY